MRGEAEPTDTENDAAWLLRFYNTFLADANEYDVTQAALSSLARLRGNFAFVLYDAGVPPLRNAAFFMLLRCCVCSLLFYAGLAALTNLHKAGQQDLPQLRTCADVPRPSSDVGQSLNIVLGRSMRLRWEVQQLADRQSVARSATARAGGARPRCSAAAVLGRHRRRTLHGALSTLCCIRCCTVYCSDSSASIQTVIRHALSVKQL